MVKVERVAWVIPLIAIACDSKPKRDPAPPLPAPQPRTHVPTAMADPVVDVTAATKAAFHELLDPHGRFVFEIVEGKRLDNLKPIAGSPRVIGTIRGPERDGDYTKVFLNTRPEREVPGSLMRIARQMFLIVFYEDGIRQLAAFAVPAAARDNIRGFTFPNALDQPVTIEGKPDFGNATVKVRRASLVLAGKPHDVMLAETKLVERATNAASYETYAYAPGIGPVLLCLAGDNTRLSCLRWVATEPSP